MKNKLHTIYFYIVAIILITSCEKEIKINIGKEDKLLVVNSLICPDSLIKVTVSYSQYIYYNQPIDYVNNAVVILFEDDLPIDTLKWFSNGKYQSIFKPKLNKIYKVYVTDRQQSVSATTHIPNYANIESLKVDTIINEYGNKSPRVKIRISDNNNEKNFYMIYFKGKFFSGFDLIYSTIVFVYNDAHLSGESEPLGTIFNYITDEAQNYNRFSLTFSDKTFNGSIIEIAPYDIYAEDNLHIYIQTLSEDYYNYLYSINKSRKSSSNSESIIIHSNIEGGIGILGSYNQIIIPF